MKQSKKLVILLLAVGLVAIAPLSCAKNNPTATPANQTVAVQQGPLIVQIPATGNLAFSQTADVAFQGAGTVDQIKVEVGDAVKKGDILATLDQTAWQTFLTGLQTAVTNAQRTETKSEIALSTDNQKLQQALNTLSSSPSISTAQTNFNNAYDYYQSVKSTDQLQLINLAKAQMQLASTILGSVTTNADQTQVTLLRMQVDVDQGAVDDAKSQMVTAQQALDDANAASPQIVAPYDGIVTVVSVTGGQTIAKGTVGVSIADQTKFEADVLVNETDISNVRIGATATVQPNAASTVLFPATVTAIAPTATVSSGVVNYKVTVEVSNQPGGFGNAAAGQASGQTPGAGGRGGGQTPPAGQGNIPVTPGQGRGFVTGGQNAAGAADGTSFQLKSGLTVSINILVQAIPNAIQVPSRAITRQAGQSTVKVIKSDGTTETRTVTAGLTNGANTQIVSGLSADEKVSVPQSTATTTTQNRGAFGGTGGGPVIIR